MKDKDLSVLNVKVSNPIKKIRENQEKNYHRYNRPSDEMSQLYYFRPKFTHIGYYIIEIKFVK